MLKVLSMTGTNTIDLSRKIRPVDQQGMLSPNYNSLVFYVINRRQLHPPE